MSAGRGRRRALRAGLAIAASMALAGAVPAAGPAPAASAAARTHTVVIENLRFVPESLEVRAGDTVVWTNRDLVPHTATAQGRFDSGNLDPNRSWKHVFSTPGTLPYVCLYHPTMKARVVVR